MPDGLAGSGSRKWYEDAEGESQKVFTPRQMGEKVADAAS